MFAGQVVTEGTGDPLESGKVSVALDDDLRMPVGCRVDEHGRFRIVVTAQESVRQAWLHVTRYPDHPAPLHDGVLFSAPVSPGENLRIEIPDRRGPALSALVGHLEFAGEPCERGYIVLRARGDRAMAHQNGYLSGNRVEVFVPSRAGPFTDEVPGPLVLSLVDFGNLHARWSFASFTELRASLATGLRGPEHAVRLKLDPAPQALPPSALVWAVGEEGEARERRIDESGEVVLRASPGSYGLLVTWPELGTRAMAAFDLRAGDREVPVHWSHFAPGDWSVEFHVTRSEPAGQVPVKSATIKAHAVTSPDGAVRGNAHHFASARTDGEGVAYLTGLIEGEYAITLTALEGESVSSRIVVPAQSVVGITLPRCVHVRLMLMVGPDPRRPAVFEDLRVLLGMDGGAWLEELSVLDRAGASRLSLRVPVATRQRVAVVTRNLYASEELVVPAAAEDQIELVPAWRSREAQHGVVLDQTGRPVADASVEQLLVGIPVPVARTRTDAEGRFVLQACSELSGELVIRAGDRVPDSPPRLDPSQVLRITVR